MDYNKTAQPPVDTRECGKQVAENSFKLPERKENSHKGTFGKVLNISGSRYMPGAAFISSMAAFRSGCGYVFLATDESVINCGSWQTSPIVFVPRKKIKEQLESSQALLIGCGLGAETSSEVLFENVFKLGINIPTVIDADGLNLLSKLQNVSLPQKLVLTPHPLEASRLLGGVEVEKILADTEFWAKEISKKYNCVTALKTHRTVVTSLNGEVYHNSTGNSALAKAGSGDVLAGIIVSFLAQGMDVFEATCLAVYIHGLAGDIVRNELTAYCSTPADVINALPKAFNTLL